MDSLIQFIVGQPLWVLLAGLVVFASLALVFVILSCSEENRFGDF